jgi:4-hydroxybenzoyl-CoA reductase subunit beta
VSSGRLPDFIYLRPQTIEDLLSLIDEHKSEVTLLAGGTELLVRMRQRLCAPQYVVSLNGVASLDYVKYDENTGLTIGPLTTIYSLVNSSPIRERYTVLSQAAREVSAIPLHYTSTVGGNLCIDTRCIFYNQSSDWSKARPPCFKRGGDICHAVKGSNHCHSVYQGDLAPALIALAAKVKISQKNGEKIIPLNEFFTNSGENPNVLQPNEVITEIQLPPPTPNSTGSYQKLRVRQAIDFPLAAVAVVLDMDKDGVCRKAEFVLGAVSAAPVEVTAINKILNGRKIDNNLIDQAAEEAVKAAHPVDNLSIDAGYRRKMVRVLTKRAIEKALSEWQGNQ